MCVFPRKTPFIQLILLHLSFSRFGKLCYLLLRKKYRHLLSPALRISSMEEDSPQSKNLKISTKSEEFSRLKFDPLHEIVPIEELQNCGEIIGGSGIIGSVGMSKTLNFLPKSEEFLKKEDYPVEEIKKVENPIEEFPKLDEIIGGSENPEVSQISKTLVSEENDPNPSLDCGSVGEIKRESEIFESVELVKALEYEDNFLNPCLNSSNFGEIEDTRLVKNLDSGNFDWMNCVSVEIEDFQLVETLESEEIVEKGKNTISDSCAIGGCSKIDDAHVAKTPEENRQLSKTLREFTEGVEKLEDVKLGEVEEEMSSEEEETGNGCSEDKEGAELSKVLGKTSLDEKDEVDLGVGDDNDNKCRAILLVHKNPDSVGIGGGPSSGKSSSRCKCPESFYGVGCDEEKEHWIATRSMGNLRYGGYPPGHPRHPHDPSYYHHLYRSHMPPYFFYGPRHFEDCDPEHCEEMEEEERYLAEMELGRHALYRGRGMYGRLMLVGEGGMCLCDNPMCKRNRPDLQESRGESSSYRFSRWSEREPCHVGAGLLNLGNTCFINAIIQCFTHTVPLVEGLQSMKHDTSSHGQDEFCILCAVSDLFERSLALSGKVISPIKLVDNLNHISSFFNRDQQEDAHEFLQCLLDKLDSTWTKYEANTEDSSSSDISLVKQVFGGRLVSQLCCCKCGHSSYAYEPFVDLSLEIESVDDLDSALKSFTKVENIEDTEKFICAGCKEQAVQVEKQLMLDQAPAVAALHLKRFKIAGYSVDKIDKKVKYPLELDLQPYSKGAGDDNDNLKYELIGFVVHAGFSPNSGHYFCYIRTSSEEWYRFDDSKVRKVTEITALDQEAYILFYARKGTPWFSGLIEKWKAQSEQKLNTSPKSVLDGMNAQSTTFIIGVSIHESNAVSRRDTDVETCGDPSSGLRHDAAETEPSTALSDSKIGDQSSASCSSEPIHDDALAGKVEDDTQISLKPKNSSSVLSTSLSFGEDAVGENCKDEIGDVSAEACPQLSVENILADEPKSDTGVNLTITREPETPNLHSVNETPEVTYPSSPLHPKVEGKASSAKKSIGKVKRDPRREAVRYINDAGMPRSKAQKLLALINGPGSSNTSSKKRRKLSSYDEPSPKKRVKINPKSTSWPVAASV